ncbi:MAG TPA: amidohydrolase family protein [Acidimicrobiales bacterium]|nr:amidohydrolase family protein [Acidimicrobiales bacterium]
MRRAFVGGRVETMDGGPAPGVVLVSGGRIEAVGDHGLLEGPGEVETVDLQGRLLLPGFVDAHHHLSIAALEPVWADLEGVDDPDRAAALLADAAARTPGATWVRGCHWSRDALRLTRHDLDAMGFDRPAVVACTSLHRGVVSSHGLDVLGIDAGTADPPGGRIHRDRAGRPTGLLIETAWSRAHALSVAGTADPDRYADLIEDRARLLLTYGITAVHDAAMSPRAEAAYRRLAAEGRLPVSVLGFPHAADLLTGPDRARWEGPVTGEGDDRFRVGPVKVFADGVWPPACDGHVGGERVRFGEVMPGLGEHIRAAVGHGFGVAVHAVGNVGLGAALDGWSAAVRGLEPDHGLRVEHATLAGPGDIDRMRRLGATGVVQPGFVDGMGDLAVGLEFDEQAWLPFADLAGRDVPLAASSDFPCSSTAAPLPLSRFGVERRTAAGALLGPEQALPLATWLRLWTAGAADAGEQSGERGRIRPGLRADFVVLAGDVDGALDVAQTWVAGECVHEATG